MDLNPLDPRVGQPSASWTMPGWRRRQSLGGAAALLMAALATGACNEVTTQVQDTIEAASEGAQLVQFCVAAARVAQAVEGRDMEAAAAAGQDMVTHAPDEILPAAQFLLDAAREAQAGDSSKLTSQDGRAAADEIARFTQDRCDPR